MLLELSMKFIFVHPRSQDKNVEKKGLHNSHCLLKGNKPARQEESNFFPGTKLIVWALIQQTLHNAVDNSTENVEMFYILLFL